MSHGKWVLASVVGGFVALLLFLAFFVGREYNPAQNGNRIEVEGREAGAAGVPVHACPYSLPAWRDAWCRGWISGFRESRRGDGPNTVTP